MTDTDTSHLQVLPLRVEADVTSLRHPIHPNLPKFHFVLLLIGPRASGKGCLISNLLLNPSMLHRENYQSCHYISPTIYNDRTAAHIRNEFEGTLFDRYSDKIINNLVSYQKQFSQDEKERQILVVDDCCGYKTPALDALSTRSRHNNISIILSTQQCKSVRKIMRNQATNVILFRTKNYKELLNIYEEWGCMYGSFDTFKRMFNYSTAEKYSFMHLQLDYNPPRAFKCFTEDITNKFD